MPSFDAAKPLAMRPSRKQLAKQHAEKQRGKEQSRRETRTQGNDRGQALQQEERCDDGDADVFSQLICSAPWPDDGSAA